MRAVPELWGVLNVTPDSFSDGGRYFDAEAARARVRELAGEGADVIDVGGESTRPPGRTYGAGYAEVEAAEELRRVLPAIESAAREGLTVSIDTTKAEVAASALGAGASIVNHVGERPSDALLAVVADRGAGLVVMHNIGRGEARAPATPIGALAAEVRESLLREADRAIAAGVRPERVWLDPGVGFAKTAAQSAGLLGCLPSLVATGYPVLVGASRKSFIAELSKTPDGSRAAPAHRLGGSIAAALCAAELGARGLRVHDVGATRQALLVAASIRAEAAS